MTEIGLSKRPNVIGDMVLTPKQMEQLEKGRGGEGATQAIDLEAQLWPSAVVLYTLDRNLGMYPIIFCYQCWK